MLMDMRFGILNVRSLYRAGALGLVTSEMEKHRMDLVGVQEVRWNQGIILYFMGEVMGTEAKGI